MLSRTFAAHKHASLGQTYGESEYVTHLDDVHDILVTFGYATLPIANFEMMVSDASYLHDIVEDTDETEQSLSEQFHPTVARATQNLSDVEAKTRKERKLLTNAKFSKYSLDITDEFIALVIKPADRFSNMRQSFNEKSSMMKVYFKEYPEFRKAVYRKGVVDAIWVELDSLYNQYEEYLSS